MVLTIVAVVLPLFAQKAAFLTGGFTCLLQLLNNFGVGKGRAEGSPVIFLLLGV